jgi:RNA polymerase sigma-70 factor (ECF subfamily)
MSLPDTLAQAFARALGPETAIAPTRGLADALEVAWRAGSAQWPALQLAPEAFAMHLSRCVDPHADLATQVSALPAADLFLACACAAGDSRAIAALEDTYARQIGMAVRRIRDQHLLPDDFRQMLRGRLFVGAPGEPAAIARYTGQGPLGAWLRVTALRAALNATRSKRPSARGLPSEEELFRFDDRTGDPELDHLKLTYRDAFRRAFQDTLAALPSREKTLLRQSVVHGLSVREIARLHDVHHATAARWLAGARTMLLSGTREVLRARLDVSARELDSIMDLIESRLDVSVAGALGEG